MSTRSLRVKRLILSPHPRLDVSGYPVFRLAIADAVRAPKVARALDCIGREASRAALRQIMTQAQESGLTAVQSATS